MDEMKQPGAVEIHAHRHQCGDGGERPRPESVEMKQGLDVDGKVNDGRGDAADEKNDQGQPLIKPIHGVSPPKETSSTPRLARRRATSRLVTAASSACQR